MYRMMTAQWKSLRGMLIMPLWAPSQRMRGIMKSSGVKPMAPHCSRFAGWREPCVEGGLVVRRAAAAGDGGQARPHGAALRLSKHQHQRQVPRGNGSCKHGDLCAAAPQQINQRRCEAGRLGRRLPWGLRGQRQGWLFAQRAAQQAHKGEEVAEERHGAADGGQNGDVGGGDDKARNHVARGQRRLHMGGGGSAALCAGLARAPSP